MKSASVPFVNLPIVPPADGHSYNEPHSSHPWLEKVPEVELIRTEVTGM
jgi:hypothetical protein